MWIGRYLVGQSIPLSFCSRNASGVPTMPDAVPVAELYDSAGSQVGSDIELASVDRYAVDTSGANNALFQRRFRLTSGFSAGRYSVLYKWTVSAVAYKQTACFDVLYASDADGTVIGLFGVPLGGQQGVHWDVESGKIEFGRNPR